MESKEFCVICLSDKTSEKWWRHNKQGLRICQKCYMKFIRVRNRQNDKKWNDLQNPRHLRFKNKIILLTQNPRKGVCSWCKKKGHTVIHHIKYHYGDPLKDTIEICQSCHINEHRKLGDLKNK